MEDDIPNELEWFLIRHGFFKSEYAPTYVKHTVVARPKVKRKLPKKTQQWTPSFEGDECPF